MLYCVQIRITYRGGIAMRKVKTRKDNPFVTPLMTIAILTYVLGCIII